MDKKCLIESVGVMRQDAEKGDNAVLNGTYEHPTLKSKHAHFLALAPPNFWL